MKRHNLLLLIPIAGILSLFAQTFPQPPTAQFDPSQLRLTQTLGNNNFHAADNIDQASFSPDGKQLLLRSHFHLQTFDVDTGKRLTTYRAKGDLTAAAWLADGKQILFSERDSHQSPGEIYEIDPATSHPRLIFSSPAAITSILPITAFQFAAGDDTGKIHIVDRSSGHEIQSLTAGTTEIKSIRLSADAQRLTAVTTQAAFIWTLSTGALLNTITPALPPDAKIDDIQLALDNATIYVVLHDGAVHAQVATRILWSTLLIIPQSRRPGFPGRGAFSPDPDFKITLSPDAKTLAIQQISYRNLALQFISAADGSPLIQVAKSYDFDKFLGFSPDSSHYFLNMLGALASYDVATAKKTFPSDSPSTLVGPITHIVASPDNNTLFLGNRGAIRWNLQNAQADAVLNVPGANDIRCMDLSPDGKSLLVLPAANPVTRIVDAQTMIERRTIEPQHPFGPAHPGPAGIGVDRWIWSDAHSRIATINTMGRHVGEPLIVALATNALTLGPPQEYDDIMPTAITGTAISSLHQSDQNFLAFWNATTGDQLATLNVGAIDPSANGLPLLPIAFSPDNHLMLLPVGHTLRLYKSTETAPTLPTAIAHAIDLRTQYAINAAFHPDGTHFVILLGSSPYTPTDIAWGQITPTGFAPFQPLPNTSAPSQSPQSLAFSPDGKTLYIGFRDSTISVYRAP